MALVPELVADINPAGTFGPISQIVALGDAALFVADDGVHGEELWRSDGTSEGTQLLADLNPGGGSSPLMMAPVGDFWLFTADDGEHGRELWRTDGTTEGTELLFESAEGAESRFVFPSGDAVAQSAALVYFSLKGADESTEIWGTDGTTSRLLMSLEFHGSSPSTSDGVREMAVTTDETLYFVYDDGLIGTELWMRHELEVQSFDISNAIVNGSRLDGEPRELTAIGDSVYFSAYSVFTGREVWRATPEIPVALSADLVPGPGHSNPDQFTEFGLDAYFFVHDAVAGRQGLWKRESDDGQYARVKELPYLELFGLGSGLDRDLVATEERLFFVASDGNSSNPSRRLWTSDGTTDGTNVIAEFPAPPNGQNTPRIHQMTALGSKLFFSAETAELGRELWISDGTIDGTRVVRDIQTGSGDSLPSHLTVVGDRLFFTANDGVNGSRLWVSDGTEEGTRPIELLANNGVGSRPEQLTKVGNTIYFAADDGLHGRELWKTDGTTSGTTLVKDVVLGANGSLGQNYTDSLGPLTAFNKELYFLAYRLPQRDEIWRTGGTDSNTQDLGIDVCYHPLLSRGDVFRVEGETLYYIGCSGLYSSHGNDAPSLLSQSAFWLNFVDDAVYFMSMVDLPPRPVLNVSDGTVAGTQTIGDLGFSLEEIDEIVDFRVVGGFAFYIKQFVKFVDSNATATQLISVDLSSKQERLLREVVDYDGERPTYEMIVLNDTLLFTSRTAGQRNLQLWSSDGTLQQPPRQPPTGTVLVKDFQNGLLPDGPIVQYVMEDKLYLAVNAFRNGQSSVELWVTDGTSDGTRLVKDFRTGYFDAYPTQFTALNGVLYFSMSDEEHGEELWRSDGTADGTVVVADIAPGGLSSFPTNLTVVGDVLYFAANDATRGAELWRSDGTAAGTVLVADLRSGGGPDGSSYPHDFTLLNGSLYFGARDRVHGDELWRIRPSDGDTNLDGQVDLSDLNNVRNYFGGTGLGDADGDGDVDLDDLNLVRNHFGATPAEAHADVLVSRPEGDQAALARAKDAERAVDLLFTSDRFAPNAGFPGSRKLRR